MKKSFIAAALAAASLAPVVATAQDKPAAAASAPTVGAKVYGPEGTEVGAVESVQNGIVTVNTGTSRAGLPTNAFAVRENGLTISMNRAQLEAAVSGAAAEASTATSAAIVADAPVKSSDGVVLGTITKVEGDDVTVLLSSGSSILLKKSNLGLVNNELAIGMTAQAFNKQALASGASKAGADAAAPASGEAAAAEGSQNKGEE